MRCPSPNDTAPKPRRAVTGRRPSRRQVCLLFTVSCVFARPAAAECGPALDEHIRRATIDAVQRVLHTLDRDATRYRNAYGPDVLGNSLTGVGGIAFSPRKLCVPGREPDEASEQVLGAVGQAGFGGWRLRALALAPSLAAGSWDPDMEQPKHDQQAYGAFIGYDRWLELGLVGFGPRASSALTDSGWLLSAASHGVRLAFVLDEQRLEDVDIAVGPVLFDRFALGGGGRWLHAEDVYTAYAAVTDIRLSGTWEGGVFVDTRAELELNTGRLRSAEAVLRLTFDVAPEAHAPPEERIGGYPPDVLRVHADLRAMASVFHGSRVPGGVVGGGGLAWEVGLYGRHAGFSVDAVAWINDPSLLDHAEDPTGALRFEVMARLTVGGPGWALGGSAP